MLGTLGGRIMLVEKISEGFYRASLEWRDHKKFAFGTTKTAAMRNAYSLQSYINATEKTYEAARKNLEVMMKEQDGTYYYEDALLRRKLGVPLSKDNESALEWYETMQAEFEGRPSPWEAEF
jgi:hypothetical protein